MNLRKNGRSALLQTCHSSFVKNSEEYALKAKPEEHCAHRMCIIYIGRRWRGGMVWALLEVQGRAMVGVQGTYLQPKNSAIQ